MTTTAAVVAWVAVIGGALGQLYYNSTVAGKFANFSCSFGTGCSGGLGWWSEVVMWVALPIAVYLTFRVLPNRTKITRGVGPGVTREN